MISLSNEGPRKDFSSRKCHFFEEKSVFSVQLWLAVILGGLLIRYIIFKRRYNLPPRPYGWPIIGNMLALDQKSSLARWMQKVARDHGPVFRLSLGLQDVIVVNDIKHAHEAMVERGKDFSGRPEAMLFQLRSENYQDIGFADADQPNWTQRRKVLALALRNFTSGKAYEARVHDAFGKLMKHLDAKADQEESFDPKDYCKFFVYNQIAAMCFGTSYEFDDEIFMKLVETTDEYNRLFEEFQLSDIFKFSKYLPFDLPDRRKAKKILEYSYEYFSEQFDEHRENLTGKETSDLTYSVMKMIAENGNPSNITAVQERQIIIDVFTAGIDTTQMQFRWMLACLAEYQHIQGKIYEEILDTMGPIDKNEENIGVSSSEYKAKMPYSEAFILETTRFGTVAVIGLPRKTLNDTKIGDYDIPKGTQVLFNQWAINYDENENKDPFEFRPERFLTEDGFLGPRPSSYMPFGLGRRSCPGEGASRNTLWITLIMLLRRYRVLPGRNFQLKYKDKFIVAEPVDYDIVLRYRNSD